MGLAIGVLVAGVLMAIKREAAAAVMRIATSAIDWAVRKVRAWWKRQ